MRHRVPLGNGGGLMSEQQHWALAPVANKRKKWPWVVGGITLAFFLLVGGVALIAVSVNEVVNDLNAEEESHAITKAQLDAILNAERESHAITKAQFNAIAIGTPKADVISTLGKEPEDAQKFVSEGIIDAADVKSSCIYYNESGETFGSRFQFCFDGNVLTSRNAY